MTGIELIAAERARQVAVEGWTTEHDDQHEDGELALAAACYASPELRSVRMAEGTLRAYGENYYFASDPWPWDKKFDKRAKHSRLKQLTIAGALIAAEIDRLQRKTPASTQPTPAAAQGKEKTENADSPGIENCRRETKTPS
jgi:hypothetical protein